MILPLMILPALLFFLSLEALFKGKRVVQKPLNHWGKPSGGKVG
jgi:hypothetical protein